MAKFFIVALTVILVMQGFVTWHVWRVLPFSAPVKAVIILFMLMALGCMVLQFKSDRLPLGVATAMYEIGDSWLVLLFYLLMAFLLLDIGRLVHLVPSSWLRDNAVTSIVLTGLMLTVFIAGNIHYHDKQRREIQLTTDKRLEHPLKIVMLSDMHAGFPNHRAEVGRWVDLVNAEKPDLVLIAGDIVDGNVRPLLEYGTCKEFKRFDAPVLACLGNHEYITGVDKSIDLIRKNGICLLRDQTQSIAGVVIVGRDDRSNRQRKGLDQLLQDVPADKYIILLDHQPFNLEEAETNSIDLQLSGHTHQGQVWPLNWLTKKIYECDHGQWQRGKTDYYVSSGIGIWGGKFRIGTDSEYAVITITSRR